MSWRVSENPSSCTSVHKCFISAGSGVSSNLTCLPFSAQPGGNACAVGRTGWTRQNYRLQFSYIHWGCYANACWSRCGDVVGLSDMDLLLFLLFASQTIVLFYTLLSVFACCHWTFFFIYFFFFIAVLCQQKANPEKHACLVFLFSLVSRSQLLVCRSPQRGWSLLFALNITRVFV